MLSDLAICPTMDQDFFEFDIAANATDVSVEIEYQSTQGRLRLDLLNGTGASIMSASPVGGNENILGVSVANLPTGTYYAQVSADQQGIENNYSIKIVTTP